MDIVTHAMMGIVGASPALATYPLGAMAFAMGSVVPDLDALSRLFGKNAFMTWHQTYSHALPVIGAITLIVAAMCWYFNMPIIEISIGFGLGMAAHSLLDVSNTYGIKLFAPFSNRRLSSEWVFFIDLPVILTTSLMLGLVVWQFQVDLDSWILFSTGISFWVFIVIYWGLKGILKARALQTCPENTFLIPCAFLPWRFLGCHQIEENQVELFTVNAILRSKYSPDSIPVQSAAYKILLEQSPEFVTMRNLSPMFHVVEVQDSNDGKTVKCRDLRTRNFNTRFGDLNIDLGFNNEIINTEWHV